MMKKSRESTLLGRFKQLFGGGEKGSDNLPPDVPFRVPEEFKNIGRQPPPNVAVELGDVDLVFLRQQLLNHLSMAELISISSKLSIDFEALPGGKGRKVQGLLQQVQREGTSQKLVDHATSLKPNIPWQPPVGAHDVD